MNYEPNEIANEIRLLRGGRLKHASFLIVEGRSDELFCKFYVADANHCEVIPVDGRPNVMEVFSILEHDNFPGVLAITDADFDVLRGITPDHVNLFFTDTHDLETMILKSEAFDKFLAGYGDLQKIVAFETSAGKQSREVLLNTGQWVGYLRWISSFPGVQSVALCVTRTKLRFGLLNHYLYNTTRYPYTWTNWLKPS